MKYTKLTLLLLCACLTGCGRTGPALETAPTQPAATEVSATEAAMPVETVDISLEAQALAQAPEPATALVPVAEASGLAVKENGITAIDYSHTADGYVMVRSTERSENRLKVLVQGPTTTYSYDLPRGNWVVFPLSDGSGSYRVGVYRNVSGTKYATELTASFETELLDEFAPFLRPNQYVNYTEATAAVAKGLELTAGMEDTLEKVAAVYDYVVSTLSYDYDKAATVKSGYLPDLNQVLAEKKGICFDYAALMTAMLRSQGIPCKLVVGYAGSVYHAWISVWTQEHGWVDGSIFFDGQVWKRMDPTFASSGARSEDIMDYIENGNYTAKYLY